MEAHRQREARGHSLRRNRALRSPGFRPAVSMRRVPKLSPRCADLSRYDSSVTCGTKGRYGCDHDDQEELQGGMVNVRLTIEYDGSAFHGWQSQPNLRTVETELKRAISLALHEPIRAVYASGRTDSGVHARAQVVNFHCSDTPNLVRLARAVSGILRHEVSVLHAAVVPDDFHARYSARSKQYSYTILNRPAPPTIDRHRCWHLACPLDLERMQAAAALLVGTHDFTSFRAAGCQQGSSVKQIMRSELVRIGDTLRYEIEGSGFLKQMVRNIVGTLVALGRHAASIAPMEEVLAARNRQAAAATAPATGLALEWVQYDDFRSDQVRQGGWW